MRAVQVLFEAVGLVILLERDRDLVEQMAVQLGKFIAAKEPNTRYGWRRPRTHASLSRADADARSYLGLENMGRLSMLPQVSAAVKRNQPQIAESLHDPDISIRRRALDLLYGMCDASNAQGVVKELLDYLIVSDFAIREELVLKIAILAEKYAPTQRWYVDVVLALMDKAGDFVSDDIWHRVVQIVTNASDLQAYAAEQVLVKLRAGSAHESMLKISGYLLGEFGHLLALPTGPLEYFGLLQHRFVACSLPTKALLLSAYAKARTLAQCGCERRCSDARCAADGDAHAGCGICGPGQSGVPAVPRVRRCGAAAALHRVLLARAAAQCDVEGRAG
jgi:AP-2 complex subunit alpha